LSVDGDEPVMKLSKLSNRSFVETEELFGSSLCIPSRPSFDRVDNEKLMALGVNVDVIGRGVSGTSAEWKSAKSSSSSSLKRFDLTGGSGGDIACRAGGGLSVGVCTLDVGGGGKENEDDVEDDAGDRSEDEDVITAAMGGRRAFGGGWERRAVAARGCLGGDGNLNADITGAETGGRTGGLAGGSYEGNEKSSTGDGDETGEEGVDDVSCASNAEKDEKGSESIFAGAR
jgi:hypothetical protein